MEIPRMKITEMPPEAIFYILQYVPIDTRADTRIGFFPHFEVCFESSNKVAQNQISVGIEQLNLPDLSGKLLKLCGQYSLGQRWRCSGANHQPTVKFSSNQAMETPCSKCGETALICLLKRSSGCIECLDLRGLNLTASLMQTIAKHCPKICCLNLTFASFETEYAFKLFVKHVCPKIKHLAMDNLFIKPCLLPNCQVPCSNGRHNTYRRIFSSAVKLVDLEVTLFSNGHFVAEEFSYFRSKDMSLMSLRFLANKNDTVHRSALYLRNFSESKAKHLQMLKLKTNYGLISYEDYNYQLFLEAKSLVKLDTLNLNFMIWTMGSEYNVQLDWPQLEHFAIDQWSLRGSAKLLTQYMESCFSFHLKTLKICDCTLSEATMRVLAEKCPQLRSLTLADVKFMKLIHDPDKSRNIGAAFRWFQSLKHLKTLCIQFTLKATREKPETLCQLEDGYLFPGKQIDKLDAFLRTPHPSLEKVLFENWPGLQFPDVNRPKQIAKETGLFLRIKPYCQALYPSVENICHCRLHPADN